MTKDQLINQLSILVKHLCVNTSAANAHRFFTNVYNGCEYPDAAARLKQDLVTLDQIMELE